MATKSLGVSSFHRERRRSISVCPCLIGSQLDRESRLGMKIERYRSLLFHSTRFLPPSNQPLMSESSANPTDSSFLTRDARRLWFLPPGSGLGVLEFSLLRLLEASFSNAARMQVSARRFGAKGNVHISRGGTSGVNGRGARQNGHATLSCQDPQVSCRREKNHFKRHIAQKE